jgi:ABC-2 type transport system permease protein
VSETRLPPLLRNEVRLLLRERLIWVVLALLLAALCLGAQTGALRVAGERVAIAQAQEDTARSVREAKAAAARYAVPGAVKVNYWQDPTHAFGYMHYFLAAYAVKPQTPLALLSAGQSEIQPTVMKTSFGFSTVFEDTAYDLGSAAALKFGPFDLAFVLVYLVPLAVIAIAGTRLAAEQDAGILRLIAAQPARPRIVAGAKFGAAALLLVPAVVGGTGLALMLAGLRDLPPGWTMPLTLLAAALGAYVVLWVAACALAASLWRGAVAALTILVLAWACFVIVLPALLGLAVDGLAPPPSRIAAIDASRRVQDAFYRGGAASTVTAAWLAARAPGDADRPDLRETPQIRRLDRDAFYDATLTPYRAALQARAGAAAAWSARLGLLSPATAFALALDTAAGTDAPRHAAFLAAASAYRQSLREFFEPRILAQEVRPKPVCPGCPARLDFVAYEAVPRFPALVTADAARGQALVSALTLWGMALALTALARRRLSVWSV